MAIRAAVIDDTNDDRFTMSLRLREIGYEVDAVDNPDALQSGPYDIALIDMVYYGDHAGPVYCRAVRNNWPSCLIIAVSAVDEREGIFRQAIEEGACTQLEKDQLTESRLRSMIQVHNCQKHKTRN